RPWRDPNPQLQEELGGNPFLAPRAVRDCHLRDQLSQLCGYTWPPSSLRFQAPEQMEALSMPANKRVRLDDRQELTPVHQPRHRDERARGGITRRARLYVPLDVQRQLLSQEQVLGSQQRV